MNEESGENKPTILRDTRTLYTVAGSAVLILLAAVLIWILVGGGEEPPSTAHNNGNVRMAATPPASQPTTDVPAKPELAAANATVQQNGGDYTGFEETLGVPLERIVRQIDYALVETLLFSGYDPHSMHILDVQLKKYHDELFHFQKLEIELESGPERFIDHLRDAIAKWAPESKLAHLGSESWMLSIHDNTTHELIFKRELPAPPAAEQQETGAKLAVVIDDLGRSIKYAKALAALPYPVTFSVLPHTPYASRVAQTAIESGNELMLHLPMEPKSYPQVNPGGGALFTTMSEQEIRSVLAANLTLVAQASGVNNHMGSKFTSYAPGMDVVLSDLKRRNMFFLDSLTSSGSVVTKEGKKIGLPIYRRSVFIDNIRDVGAIIRQLEKAARISAATGQAIAIGHPYPETLAALQQWANKSDRGANLVPVGKLKPIVKTE